MPVRTMVFACAFCASGATAQAQQGAVEITPRFAPDRPLTIELHNLSKLPVRLTRATLRFAGSGDETCSFSLPDAVALGPTESKSIPLVAGSEVLKCVTRGGTATAAQRWSVISAQELAKTPDTSGQNGAAPQAADLDYKLEIGKRAVSDRTIWHFLEQ